MININIIITRSLGCLSYFLEIRRAGIERAKSRTRDNSWKVIEMYMQKLTVAMVGKVTVEVTR